MSRAGALLCLAAVIAAPLVAQSEDDPWAVFVEQAAQEHGDFGRRCADFLAEHRPARDADLSAEFLLENLRLALAARAELPWGKSIPEERFLNDVLPYAVLDETRDPWRKDFAAKARAIVAGCTTPTTAAQALNRRFFDAIEVHYDTGRKKPNQSPKESIAQGRATCTGLSIVLVDACRSVGVPARVAGTPLWADKRGNHTWVEIWDGDWHFTGADEFDAKGLDRAWFVNAASQAVADDWRHAIWATSWKRTGSHFPLVWDLENEDVAAVNVTGRYTAVTARHPEVATVSLRVFESDGGPRIVVRAALLDPVGKVLQTVETKAGRADMNDMATLTLTPARDYLLRLRSGDDERTLTLRAASPGAETRDLVWDTLEPGSAALKLVDAWLALLPEERPLSVPDVVLSESEAKETVRRVVAAYPVESGAPADPGATEKAWPANVVWEQAAGAGERSGWLSVDAGRAKKGAVVRAEVRGQDVFIEGTEHHRVTLWLSDALLDLDRPIRVSVNGEKTFLGVVLRRVDVIHASVLAGATRETAATAKLEVDW